MRTGPHPDRLSPRGVSLPRPGGVWTRHARPRQGWEFADRPCSGQLGGGPAAPAAAAAAPGAIQPRCPRRRVGAPLLRAPRRLGPHRVGGCLALPAAAAAQHRGVITVLKRTLAEDPLGHNFLIWITISSREIIAEQHEQQLHHFLMGVSPHPYPHGKQIGEPML